MCRRQSAHSVVIVVVFVGVVVAVPVTQQCVTGNEHTD
jgi:hypothetical protein